MRKFSAGDREWTLQMNVAQARQLKDRLDLDVFDVQSLQRLAGDPYTAANVLYVLCEKQAHAAEINDEQFGELLAGDSFEPAVEALLQEIVDFFPKRQREVLRKILAQLETTKGETVALADKKMSSPELKAAMANLLTKAEAEIDAELAKLAGVGSGSASA